MIKSILRFSLDFLKEHFIFIFVVLVGVVIFWPTFDTSLAPADYQQFQILRGWFDWKVDAISLPVKFYFSTYGTTFSSFAILRQILGYDALGYRLVNFSLRMAAAFAAYLLMVKIAKNKLAGIIAALIFITSYPGLESTNWVIHFLVYLAIIVLCCFLYFWYKFHQEPNIKNMIKSALFFVASLLIQPIRLHGLPIIIFVGEIYWMLSGPMKQKYLKIRIKHSIFLALFFVVTTLLRVSQNNATDSLSRVISPVILVQALLTGTPPIFASLWLFIGNLFTPQSLPFMLRTLSVFTGDQNTFRIIALIMSFISLLFLFFCLFRRKFKVALVSIIAVMYPIIIYLTLPRLIGWEFGFVIAVEVGATFFLLTLIYLFSNLGNERQLSEMGLLGALIAVSHLIIPWLVSPSLSPDQHQTAFNVFSRYYTVSSLGTSIMLGSAVVIFVKNISKVKIIVRPFLYIFACISFLYLFLLVMSNSRASYIVLSEFSKSWNRQRHEFFWKEMQPYLSNFKDDGQPKVIYLTGDITENDKGIGMDFNYRLYLDSKNYTSPNDIIFVYNRDEMFSFLETGKPFAKLGYPEKPLDPNNFLALRIISDKAVNIKEELLRNVKSTK